MFSIKIPSFYWAALSFFGYYCAYGVLVPYFPVWLKIYTHNEKTVGLIIAIAYLFRFIGGILFSAMIKRSSQLLNALRYLAWANCLLMLSMSFIAENFWLLCAAIWLFSMTHSAGLPLSDTLATTWQQQIHLDYGKVRLIGSIAYVVGVTGFGYIIGEIGAPSIVWIITALSFLYALMQMPSPTHPPQDELKNAKESTIDYDMTFAQLLKNKITLRLMIAVSLLQGSHAAYYVYSVFYWKSIGINVQTSSILLGLSVMAEIVLFFFSTRLFQNRSVTSLFYISAIATLLRWVILGNTTQIALIATTQLLHCLTYALAHYAMVRYIATQPQPAIAKLQGLYNGLSGCAAIALFTALSGILYPISPTLTFAVMAAIALLAIPFIPRKVDAFLVNKVSL